MADTDTLHALAPHDLPSFVTAPGETDVLLVAMGLFLVIAVLAVGLLFLRLHTLPERMAHRSHKIQFELVAVLGLIALFTHMHVFWVAGLILAMIDIPDFGWPLKRIARGVETLAGITPEQDPLEPQSQLSTSGSAEGAPRRDPADITTKLVLSEPKHGR